MREQLAIGNWLLGTMRPRGPVALPFPTVHPPQAPADTPPLDRRSLVIYVSAVVLLVVFEYFALPGRYLASSWPDRVMGWWGEGAEEYRVLSGYAWWGVTSLVLRLLVPALIIIFVLRERPGAFGFRLHGQWSQLRPYLIAFGVMIPVVYVISALTSFQAKYPLYDFAVLGGWHFWGFHLFYGLQFLGLEAFFRGFLLFGLYPRLGNHAVAVMMIPYVMIHFGKPLPETLSAIVAGFVLGYLALKSRSFLWGWMLHWGVALTMDVMALGREFGFGKVAGILF
jgi:membrane protease YdiL (CAAX protease family)